jgi:mannose-6-phosphate isomerase-like protein (cupin superfamily)
VNRELVTLAAFLAFAATSIGCTTKERTGTVAGPGLTVAPNANVIPASTASSVRAVEASPSREDRGSDGVSPVIATFEDLSASGARVEFRACEQRIVAVARGHASIDGDELAAGDIFLAQGKGSFNVQGAGLAVFASTRTRVCEPSSTPGIRKTVIRGNASRELTWASGKMHAHLDTDGVVSPLTYVGRLSGTGNMDAHAHEGSWEILAAIDGAGTITVDGKSSRLAPRQVIVVPPGVIHSYTPDSGVSLNAIQMYAPPGPEQRFKGFAAEQAGSPQGQAATRASADVSAKKR